MIDDDEIYKEYHFIREKLYEMAGLLCQNKIVEAVFLCGNMYAETRIVCEKLNKKREDMKNAPM